MKKEDNNNFMPLNPRLISTRLLIIACLATLLNAFQFYRSYKSGNYCMVEVENVHPFKKKKYESIGNNDVVIKNVTELIIQPNSFLHYLGLSLNPESKEKFPLFNCFSFLAISVTLYVALRKSDAKTYFTANIIVGFTRLKYVIIGLMVLKMMQIICFNEYIETITNSKLHFVYQSGFVSYQLFLLTSVILLDFFKKGLELQKDQDLTI